jgi:hypothetical protein
MIGSTGDVTRRGDDRQGSLGGETKQESQCGLWQALQVS